VNAGVARPVRARRRSRPCSLQDLVVDACAGRAGLERSVSLAARPVLFALAALLAEAWPATCRAIRLIERAFNARVPQRDASARLARRDEPAARGAAPLARIEATPRGFALVPIDAHAVVVLAAPIDGDAGAILALARGRRIVVHLGARFALGSSQRTSSARCASSRRRRRCAPSGVGARAAGSRPPLAGFATNLLLPGALAVG
jgi:hypothetical protein